jgi:hypothetical protein
MQPCSGFGVGVVMFKFVAAVFLSVITVGSVLAQTEYFPLHSEITWTYGGNPLEIARTITLREVADHPGQYAWDGPLGNQTVSATEQGVLVDVSEGEVRPLLDFRAGAGQSWTISASNDLVDGTSVTVVEILGKKTVPFGTFENVIHFQMQPPERLRDAGLTDLWFAPKVGLIAYQKITIAGPQTYELIVTSVPDSDPVTLPTPGPIDLEDRFPAQIGLTWTYEGPFGDERQIRILEATSTGNETALILSGLMGDRVVRMSNDRVEQFSSGSWQLLFNLAAEVDETWVIDLASQGDDLLDGARAQVLESSTQIDVPYGSYTDVLHLGFSPPPGLADAGLVELWIARGVGIVAWSEQSIAGPRTYRLSFFANRFEPTHHPEPTPFPDPIIPQEAFRHRFATNREGMVYSIGATSDVVRRGDVLFIEYLATPVEGGHDFHFNSSQQIEFRLLKGSGEAVWVWSSSRSFSDALKSLTLAKGDTIRFVERLDLRSVQIPAGAYDLVGFLPTSDTGQGTTVSGTDTEMSISLLVEENMDVGSLEGTIRDTSGRPIPNVTVGVNPESVSISDGVAFPAIASFTGQDGRFRFERLSPGSHRVTASLRGYATASLSVNIDGGSTVADLTLRRQDLSRFPNAYTVITDLLSIDVATDRVRYDVGDTLRVRYQATNLSGQSLPMLFPSGQVFDLTLSADSNVFWTWSQTRIFPAVVTDTTLAAGEVFSFEAEEIIPPSWAEQGDGLLLEAYLAVFNLEAGGGLSRGTTRGIVKLQVGGKQIPDPGQKPEGVSARLNVDRTAYGRQDTIVVDYVLSNATSDSLTMRFSSGQRYELSLSDSRSGDRVWTWSMNKLFDQSAGNVVNAPGSVYTFRETIRLGEVGPNLDGVWILEGHLTLPEESLSVRLGDTRASRRLWIGARPPAEEPPLSASRVGRAMDATVSTDSVSVTYMVWNGGGKDINTRYPSGQSYDFVLRDGTREVWRWSEDRGFIQVVRDEMLAAGDTIRVEEAFVWPTAAESLMLVAYLNVSDALGGYLTQEETTVRRRLIRDPLARDAATTVAQKSDFDSSGVVDFPDFISFAVAFGTRSGEFSFQASFDLDDDGQVGFSDFLLFAGAFGSPVSAP